MLSLAFACVFGLALARYLTFNNCTFDLAFYARMAWGMVRLDFWDPILDAHHAGLHLSPVLAIVGALGVLIGTVPALLLAQSLACVLAAERLGVMGARHLGERGWWVGALALLLHPNLGHVATYEAHPGTLAIYPLALAIERLDAKSSRGFVWACVAVLTCREDLGLMTALLGVLAWRAGMKRVGVGVALGSLAYVALFVVVLHPMLAPGAGSFEAHFGPWGDGFGGMVGAWLSDPLRLLGHLFAPQRMLYWIVILGPLAMLPLGGLRWLLPALPIFGINLLSHFPTTTNLDSHYSTPALPFLVAATIVALARTADRRRHAELALMLALVVSSIAFGVRPTDHVATGPTQEASARMVARIPDGASVQAPDPLLAHLAERERVHRAPPPDRNADYVVLDLSHRERYRHREDLLRTAEEPEARMWLAKSTYGVVLHDPPWALLERGADPRAALKRASGSPRHRLCACLSVARAERLDRERVALILVAHSACPNDLALRIDTHVELLFEGAVSPAHLREGDVVRSVHHHASGELRVGALRSSGARPDPADPVQLTIPVSSGDT